MRGRFTKSPLERKVKWKEDGNTKVFVASAALDQGDINKFRTKEIKIKDPGDSSKV